MTPDSFSDGGEFLRREDAIARGMAMVAEGADVVDVGGESSRPGAGPVAAEEELDRVVPVVRALAPHVRVSVDTVKPEVAEAAVAAGASLLNDISASLEELAGRLGVGWIAMHMKGTPATMQSQAEYQDVVEEVGAFLSGRIEAGRRAGVGEIWADPGIGFAKTFEHNLELLAGLDRLVSRLDAPVLVGLSRKTFLGVAAADPEGPLGVRDRLAPSLAGAVWAMEAGAGMVRVHDVAATVAAVRLRSEPVCP